MWENLQRCLIGVWQMANESKRSEGPVQTAWDRVRNILGKFWWVIPALAIAGGLLAPELRAFTKNGLTPNLPWWLMGQTAVCVFWLMSGFFNVTSSDTPVSGLKTDAFLSNVVQLALVALCVYEATLNQLQWGVIIPTVATILDVFITNDRAINNAAQKPIVQQQNVRS